MKREDVERAIEPLLFCLQDASTPHRAPLPLPSSIPSFLLLPDSLHELAFSRSSLPTGYSFLSTEERIVLKRLGDSSRFVGKPYFPLEFKHRTIRLGLGVDAERKETWELFQGEVGVLGCVFGVVDESDRWTWVWRVGEEQESVVKRWMSEATFGLCWATTGEAGEAEDEEWFPKAHFTMGEYVCLHVCRGAAGRKKKALPGGVREAEKAGEFWNELGEGEKAKLKLRVLRECLGKRKREGKPWEELVGLRALLRDMVDCRDDIPVFVPILKMSPYRVALSHAVEQTWREAVARELLSEEEKSLSGAVLGSSGSQSEPLSLMGGGSSMSSKKKHRRVRSSSQPPPRRTPSDKKNRTPSGEQASETPRTSPQPAESKIDQDLEEKAEVGKKLVLLAPLTLVSDSDGMDFNVTEAFASTSSLSLSPHLDFTEVVSAKKAKQKSKERKKKDESIKSVSTAVAAATPESPPVSSDTSLPQPQAALSPQSPSDSIIMHAKADAIISQNPALLERMTSLEVEISALRRTISEMGSQIERLTSSLTHLPPPIALLSPQSSMSSSSGIGLNEKLLVHPTSPSSSLSALSPTSASTPSSSVSTPQIATHLSALSLHSSSSAPHAPPPAQETRQRQHFRRASASESNFPSRETFALRGKSSSSGNIMESPGGGALPPPTFYNSSPSMPRLQNGLGPVSRLPQHQHHPYAGVLSSGSNYHHMGNGSDGGVNGGGVVGVGGSGGVHIPNGSMIGFSSQRGGGGGPPFMHPDSAMNHHSIHAILPHEWHGRETLIFPPPVVFPSTPLLMQQPPPPPPPHHSHRRDEYNAANAPFPPNFGFPPVFEQRLLPVDQTVAKNLSKGIRSFVEHCRVQRLKRATSEKAVFHTLKGVVESVWPRARVKGYGSTVTGLSLPESDMDLVVCLPKVTIMRDAIAEEVGPLEGRTADERISWQQKLAAALIQSNWVESESLKTIQHAPMPVITFTSKGPPYFEVPIRLDVSFQSETHHGLSTNKLVTSLQEEHRLLRPLVMVMKQFLADRGLGKGFSGGLSSYALIIMCTCFLNFASKHLGFIDDASPKTVVLSPQTLSSPESATAAAVSNITSRSGEFSADELGRLLICFLRFFGEQFDPRATGISISKGFFQRPTSGLAYYAPTANAAAPAPNAYQQQRRRSFRIEDLLPSPAGFNPYAFGGFVAMNSLDLVPPHKFDPLLVEDPLQFGNNVGRNVFRIHQIQRACADAVREVCATQAWPLGCVVMSWRPFFGRNVPGNFFPLPAMSPSLKTNKSNTRPSRTNSFAAVVASGGGGVAKENSSVMMPSTMVTGGLVRSNSVVF